MPRKLIAIVMLTSVLGPIPAKANNTGVIEWEITNRFAPFETQKDPTAIFDAFKLRPGEDFEAWHKRLAQKTMSSPYKNTLANKAYATELHWNQVTFSHAPKILDYVRNEGAATTTVSAAVRLDHPGNCTWSLGASTAQPCTSSVHPNLTGHRLVAEIVYQALQNQ